jgi:hypothetical protein
MPARRTEFIPFAGAKKRNEFRFTCLAGRTEFIPFAGAKNGMNSVLPACKKTE